MKVVHVSPVFFEPSSVIGGGERYPLELARAMSASASTELISFSDHPRVEQYGSLTVRLFKPWFYVKRERISPIHFPFVRALNRADVIHCYQYHTWVTSISALWGRLHGKKIFVTDLGGGGWDLLSYHGGTWRLINGFCHISDFASKGFKQYRVRHDVIYGGVDPSKFYPLNRARQKKVLFVGRILPHKGIDVLIKAIDQETPLTVVGRNYSSSYLDQLKKLSARKKVEFRTDANDEDLLRYYNDAAVLVLPSIDKTGEGQNIGAPELLGLVALEAMACKTPVIVSSAGSLPEIVEHNKSGLVVESGNHSALGDAIHLIVSDPSLAKRLADNAYETVRTKYTWPAVVSNLMRIYATA